MIDPTEIDIEIIPGILEKNEVEIEKKIQLASEFSKIIHIDVIDGIFAPNKTFMDPNFFSKYKNDFTLEVHLMVEDPLSYLEPFAKAGFKRFIGHIERMKDLDEFVAKGQFLGEVALGIDLPTSIDQALEYIEDLDFIFLMSVKAGFSGQKFSDQVIPKIRKIRTVDDLIPIELDGGINDEILPQTIIYGANRFITTSFIFNAKDPHANYQQLLKLSKAQFEIDSTPE